MEDSSAMLNRYRGGNGATPLERREECSRKEGERTTTNNNNKKRERKGVGGDSSFNRVMDYWITLPLVVCAWCFLACVVYLGSASLFLVSLVSLVATRKQEECGGRIGRGDQSGSALVGKETERTTMPKHSRAITSRRVSSIPEKLSATAKVPFS